MSQFLRLFFATALVFLFFDLIWLTFISKRMYQNFISHLLGDTRLAPAVIFYLLYTLGMVVFILLPSIEKQSAGYLLFAAALFGLICYATYDLTNLATLKGWPVGMTLIDLAWGVFVTTLTAIIVYFFNLKILSGG